MNITPYGVNERIKRKQQVGQKGHKGPNTKSIDLPDLLPYTTKGWGGLDLAAGSILH